MNELANENRFQSEHWGLVALRGKWRFQSSEFSQKKIFTTTFWIFTTFEKKKLYSLPRNIESTTMKSRSFTLWPKWIVAWSFLFFFLLKLHHIYLTKLMKNTVFLRNGIYRQIRRWKNTNFHQFDKICFSNFSFHPLNVDHCR